MRKVYQCKVCGWESSDFSDGRKVGNTGPALSELSSHFREDHPDIVDKADNPLRVILPDYVDVVLGRKRDGKTDGV